MLFVVKRDPVFKRKKAVSERISPEQKKLMNDYQIFSYLKNERNNHPASFHVTSLHQIPLTQRSQKMNTQTIIDEIGKKPKSVDDNKQQIKKKKKSYLQIKLERYQREVQEQQSKRKQELLIQSKNLLKKDLEDIQKMSNKGVREFEERCNLYSKYYSEELLTPTGIRQEDMNLPIYKYSTIENQNKYKVLLKNEPSPKPRFTSEQVFDQYYSNPDKAKLISSQLQKLNIKLIKKPNEQENQLFDAIINNDSFTVNKLIMENKNLINIRNRIQETPLHLACKRNMKEIVELLLRYEADEQLKDLWGQTPRQVAFKLRHLEILKAALLNLVQGTPVIDIYLDGLETRKTARFNDKQQGLIRLPIYADDDDISGVVDLRMNKNKKIDHLGIRIELIGRIEILNDQKQSSDFMSMGRELDAQGIIMEDKTYKFSFNKFEKQYESYYGKEIKLRYYLRVTMNRNYGQVKKEIEFAVQTVDKEQEDQPQTSLKLEVGIEDCLHLDFEYFKQRYHLRDVVTGKVNFYLVKINIKYMELAVIRKEQIGQGATQQTDNETLVKYELMDGCPQKGEVVPIRLFLSGINMSPTFKNVSGKFSVKYILNLILVDEDDRRYFKQQEITVYRKK